MSLPKFTAESAIYKTREHYRASHAPIGASNVTVCQLPDGSYQQTCSGCYTTTNEFGASYHRILVTA